MTRAVFVILLLALAAPAFGQPPSPPNGVPLTAKAKLGHTTPLTVKLPAGVKKTIIKIQPETGITLHELKSADPLVMKLLIELDPLPDGTPTAWKYYAAFSIDGELEICTITVDGAPPGPIVPPPPPPPADDVVVQLKAIRAEIAALVARVAALEQKPVPAEKAVALTFIVLNPTVKTALVTEDPTFRAWLKAQGIGIYAITSKAALDANPKFSSVFPPAIALQDASNNVIASATIIDVPTTKAFVEKHLGK